MKNMEFSVKRIQNGVAEYEYLGDGQIERVREIVMRELRVGKTIEIYSGPTRYSTSYKGTLYLENNIVMWKAKGGKRYYVTSSGKIRRK